MKKRKKRAFTLAECATHVDNSNNKRRFAFTLAEVLITLGIIGVVAALTVPTLMQNVTNRQFETGNKVFTNKLKESLKVMNTQQILKGYTTTEAFMDEFKKHYKIANVCVDNPTQCFPKTVTWNDKEVDLSNIKDAKDMVQYGPEEEDWGTKVVGVQFANGVSGLLAYNPKCKADPFNMQAEVLNCLAIVYDLNANATPNEYGKDLMTTGNVKNLSSTAIDINGVKVTKIITSDLIAPINCTNTSSPDYIFCPTEDPTQHETDYWAGAAKACGGREHLPSVAQLEKIFEAYKVDSAAFVTTYNMPVAALLHGPLWGLSEYGELYSKTLVLSHYYNYAGFNNMPRSTMNCFVTVEPFAFCVE